MKKIALAVFCVLALLSAGLYLAHDRLLDRIMKGALIKLTTRFQTGMLEDGKLHVWFCGTGSPQVEPDRAQSCTAILAKDTFLVFDTGAGSGLKADLGNLPLARLNAVFFTHLHSDHITDLPVFANHSWRYGRTTPLHVFGPAPTARVVDGFNAALGPDVSWRSQNEVMYEARIAGAGKEPAPPSPAAVALPIGHDVEVGADEAKLVYESPGGVRVFAFLVEHEPVSPAFGYRIEYGGRIVVISGDTHRTEAIARFSKGADVLIHEAYNRDIVNRIIGFESEVPDDATTRQIFRIARLTQHYHTSPVEAAELAQTAGVKTLVFTHIIPPLGANVLQRFVLRNQFLKGVPEAFGGKVILAEDGLHLKL